MAMAFTVRQPPLTHWNHAVSQSDSRRI